LWGSDKKKYGGKTGRKLEKGVWGRGGGVGRPKRKWKKYFSHSG